MSVASAAAYGVAVAPAVVEALWVSVICAATGDHAKDPGNANIGDHVEVHDLCSY